MTRPATVLGRSARCSKCGSKGATLRLPSGVDPIGAGEICGPRHVPYHTDRYQECGGRRLGERIPEIDTKGIPKNEEDDAIQN